MEYKTHEQLGTNINIIDFIPHNIPEIRITPIIYEKYLLQYKYHTVMRKTSIYVTLILCLQNLIHIREVF